MRCRLIFTIAGLSLLLCGCFPRTQNVFFPNLSSFTVVSDSVDLEHKTVRKTFFSWEDPDRWELRLLDDGIEQARWLGDKNDVFVRNYRNNSYWKAANTDIVFSGIMDVRKILGSRWQFESQETCGGGVCARYRLVNENYENGRERIGHWIWVDTANTLPVRQKLTGDTGMAIATYSGINTTVVTMPENTKVVETTLDPFLLPDSMVSTYTAEMQLKGLPMVWPFFSRN